MGLGGTTGRAIHQILSPRLWLSCPDYIPAKDWHAAHAGTSKELGISPERARFHNNSVFIKPWDRDRALEKAGSFCKGVYFLLLNRKRAADLLLCLGENSKHEQLNKDQVLYFCARWELPAIDWKTSGLTPMLGCHGLQHDGLLWITSQKTLGMRFSWPDERSSSRHAKDELDCLYRSSLLYWFWLGQSWTLPQKYLLRSVYTSEDVCRDVGSFPCWKQQPTSSILLKTALQEDTVLLIPGRAHERISIEQGKYFQLPFIFSAENTKKTFPILALVRVCCLAPLFKWHC